MSTKYLQVQQEAGYIDDMMRGRRHIFDLSDRIDGWMVGCVDRDRITLFVGKCNVVQREDSGSCVMIGM
jgi:hypothetical protein